jgi:Putative peptidoglycan binding domain
MPEHIVKDGDCIDSIAAEHGFFPDTIWNHPDNSDLKQLRKDPNILLAGDKVMIPELQIKEVWKADRARHRFKRKGVPARLRLRFMKPKEPEPPKEEPPSASSSPGSEESHYSDPPQDAKPPEMEPRKNCAYVMYVDGKMTDQGNTDGDGKVELSIPPRAREGKIVFNPGKPEQEEIPLQLGGMDPADTITGARKRLNNLGYRCSEDGKEMTPDLKEALMRFQFENSLEAKGEFNKATQDKLKQAHGS